MAIIKVKTGGITADAVTDALIADDVVGTEHLTANEVDTAALGADAVTGAQLADNAVNSEHYTDGSVDTAHIADAQITTAKLSTAVFTGATDIGAAIVDADLFLMDDGAGGTIRKTTASRIKTYVGGGITVADQWRVNTNLSASTTGSFVHITGNWEQIDSSGQGTIGTAMSNSSGTFTFPSTGIYFVQFQIAYYDSDANTVLGNAIDFSVNNGSSYGNLAQNFSHTYNGSNVNATAITSSLVDVQNASTYKVRFYYYVSGGATIYGAGQNSTFATFIRLGDT